MKRCIVFFSLLMLFRPDGSAQKQDQEKIDSLLAAMATATEDTMKLNLFAEIIRSHVNYQPNEGLKYQEPALAIAKKINSPTYIAKVMVSVGRLYWRLGNFDAALKRHLEAAEIYSGAGDKFGEGSTLVCIAQDYFDNGNYPQAMTYLQKALKLATAAGDKKTISATYDVLTYLYEIEGNTVESVKAKYAYLKINEEIGDKIAIAHGAAGLGHNFKTLGNDVEALKYFRQALQAATEGGDKLEAAYALSFMGEVLINRGAFSEATNQYTEALKLANEIKDVPLLTDIRYGIGNLYKAQGNNSEALTNYLAAAEGYKSTANKQLLASVYAGIGIVYTRLKSYAQARQSFNKSLRFCEELNSNLALADYYRGITLLDSATANWKAAYLHHREYITLRDSAFNKETLKKLVASQMQYESDKKEAGIKADQEKKDLVVQQEIKHQRNIRNGAFAGLAVIMVFSVVIYRQRNRIAIEKKRSDLLVQDKELLIREIHHRVKNNLEVVSSLLALQSAQIDDPNTKEAMQEGQNRVQSIGIVHQKLYQGENLAAVEMKDYLVNLSESILDSFGAEKRVQIECAMEKLDIDIDTAVPLGLIINELLTNTLKYAFPDGRNGKVQIKLEKRTDGILQLQVSDNGVGKNGQVKGTGFGGQLVALLTKQLSGSMREEANNGTRIFFEFKIDKAA